MKLPFWRISIVLLPWFFFFFLVTMVFLYSFFAVTDSSEKCRCFSDWGFTGEFHLGLTWTKATTVLLCFRPRVLSESGARVLHSVSCWLIAEPVNYVHITFLGTSGHNSPVKLKTVTLRHFLVTQVHEVRLSLWLWLQDSECYTCVAHGKRNVSCVHYSERKPQLWFNFQQDNMSTW